ncbi:hypothetical protein [Treponema bryantii]|uniref:hypothetical protein n=1 Tax=Treponema bryantii TaxID=163 RepID=UPI002B31F1D8|nr:hypothetical protein TRBR_24440 [Treponema bryantii]
MKIFKLALLFTIFSVSLFVCGCKKKTAQIPVQNTITVEITKTNHAWYYFSNYTYHFVDRPQNAPLQAQKPWTESIRISSANNEACTQYSESKAFAVVNRLGILSFNDEAITLSQDASLFTDRTAGNLVFLNNVPVYSVYKSAFFNDTILAPDYKNDSSSHLFLLQFDSHAKISYPILNCNNITDKTNSEVTDFYWNGLEWCCSIKTISDIKNEFSYIRFKPLIPLLALSPSTAEGKIDIEECDADFFRSCRVHHNYTDAPDRIKKLLSGFDTKLPFIIEVKNAGGSSPRIYENTVANSKEKELNAKAILSANWSAALFEDGTLFLEGALPGKHILRSGKAVAIRLPKLPVGFIYSDFVISGTTLYAAWEESSFYKTGRAGFLQVNLERTLYSRMI